MIPRLREFAPLEHLAGVNFSPPSSWKLAGGFLLGVPTSLASFEFA